MILGEGVMLETIRKLPVLSSLSAAFGVAAGVSMATGSEAVLGALFVGAMVSPFVSGGLMIGSALDFFDKKRSKLSKIFSAAAFASAGAGLAGLAIYSGAPGWEALTGIISTSVGMTAAGVFNLASHFTQNKELSVSAKVEVTDKNDAPSSAPKP